MALKPRFQARAGQPAMIRAILPDQGAGLFHLRRNNAVVPPDNQRDDASWQVASGVANATTPLRLETVVYGRPDGRPVSLLLWVEQDGELVPAETMAGDPIPVPVELRTGLVSGDTDVTSFVIRWLA